MAGRPRAFTDATVLEDKIQEFFQMEHQPTMAGICVHLEISGETWSAYGLGKYDDDDNSFSEVIKKARKKVESVVEKRMLYENLGAGGIFWLKNHAGYTDKVTHAGDEDNPLIPVLNVTVRDRSSSEPEAG